jgi:hypothetical protein
MSAVTLERQILDAGVRQVEPLLVAHGFVEAPGDDGISHGGPWVRCRFHRGVLEISLKVRRRFGLGCPSYTEGHGYVSHDGLIRRLGCDGLEELVEGEFPSWKSKSGGDPFLAFKADLERIVLPALVKSEANFRRALHEAHVDFMRSIGVYEEPEAG